MKLNHLLLGGFLIIALLVIVSGVLLALILSKQFEETTINRAKQITANFVSAQAAEKLTKEDFIPEKFDEKEQVFSEFFNGIDTEDVIRIKVWGEDATIVYSDDKSIVGKQFPDNKEFQEAIKGEIEAEIKPPVKPENIAEKGYEQLMELYVPVTLGSEVVGVIETYTKLDFVNQAVRSHRKTIFQIILISAAIILVVTGVIFYIVRITLIIPLTKFTHILNEVSKGIFHSKIDKVGYVDENITLADSLNRVVKSLKLAMLEEIPAKIRKRKKK